MTIKKISTRNWLVFEIFSAFALLPGILAVLKPHGWIYITLWLIAALACRLLKKHHSHSLKTDWNAKALTAPVLKYMLTRYVPAAVFLTGFTWFMAPEHLFSLPRERPQAWVMVMLLYPLLSGVPQEIIFRSYFFTRYKALFRSDRAMIIASAIAFGWVHIILQNWVAVVFSGIAGLFFGDTYARTKSLAAACLEHALYGCTIFTLGLGIYFYHGQAVH